MPRGRGFNSFKRGHSNRGRGNYASGRNDRHGGDDSYDLENDNTTVKMKLGFLPENVLSYYRNVSTSLESDFDDTVSKDQFLSNVYTTLKDEGIQVSQNQTVSRILEVLFSHSKPHHMQDLFCMFSKELAIVTFDRFASHVFQSLVQYLPAIYETRDKNMDRQNNPPSLKGAIEQVCKFMESHMRDIMTHTYASHVLRSFLEALGGAQVKEEVVRSQVSRTHRKVEATPKKTSTDTSLSQDFHDFFILLKEKIVKLCNFEDHLSDANYCPVLQTVLLILHKTSTSEYEQLSDLILQKSCTVVTNAEIGPDDITKRIPDIVQNEVGSYLIELLISLANESQMRAMYDLLLRGKLIYFAVHPYANYVLQKFLTCVSDTEMFEDLSKDIIQYMEDILAVNHTGIITKLAEACKRTGHGQHDFVKALMKAFHCLEPESHQIKLVPLLASLQTYDIFFPTEKDLNESSSCLLRTINIHGSLLLQQLLQFTHTKKVVSSLLDLCPTELAGLCCDKCGSHIIDVYFQSKTVSDKYKSALLKHLQGVYVNIACNRNGSRCLENIWKLCSLNQRIMIAEELSKSQERLEGDQWGHFAYNNFALHKFNQRRKDWLDIQGASSKKQQLLQNILQGTGNKKKRKIKPESHVENVSFETAEVNKTEKLQKCGNKVKHHKKVCDADLTLEEKTSPKSEPSLGSLSENDELRQNKRKRKKEKKRAVRNTENISDPLDVEEGSNIKNKKKRRKDNDIHLESSGEKNRKVKKEKRVKLKK
ncbi:unnamed protein product [Lymnaea stagnalis]|uniref:Nucleolar protein 9 n=1 Tax=Lymnaea stagnalis TaxID=6523 RepID=A0AAV2HFX3_LYMST